MAHRYRLYPAKSDLPILFSHIGQSRWVWNEALKAVKDKAPFFDLKKARAEHDWLAEGSSSVQQQALRDLNRAFANAKKGSHGFPKWRKRGECESFCVRDVTVTVLNKRWAEVTVPKCGKVKFKQSRPLPPDYGMARVTLDKAGWWHVSFSAPQPAIDRVLTGSAIGIDLGVTTTLVLSDGQLLRAPKVRPREQRRIERLQQRLPRQKKGSRRRKRTKDELGWSHQAVVRRRNDWIEKRTTELVLAHDVIVIEDLRVKDMVKAPPPKPDPERVGNFLPNGRRAKAGLNRSIHAQSWSRFCRRLEDKARVSGVTVVPVNPAFTSLTCRACGHVAKENRESQAVFSCVACGHTNHADINAAENILARGLALAPTPGHGARELALPARRSPALTGGENSLVGAVA